MELLSLIESDEFHLWGAQVIVVFFLLGGVTLLLIGISLFINSAATLVFFSRMNHWVSLRRATKPLEVMRDTRQSVQDYRYWLAAIFVFGGGFALYGLLAQFDGAAVIYVLGLDFLKADFANWLVDSARWVLITGNLLGIVVGIMLAFFPAALVALEARGSRWTSHRQAGRGADTMRVTTLDTWVTVRPHAAGGVMVVFALVTIVTFGLMLPKVW